MSTFEDKLASLFRRVRRLRFLVEGILRLPGLEEPVSILDFISTTFIKPLIELIEPITLSDIELIIQFIGRSLSDKLYPVPELSVFIGPYIDSLGSIPRLHLQFEITETINLSKVIEYLFLFSWKEIITQIHYYIIIKSTEALSLIPYLFIITYFKEAISIATDYLIVIYLSGLVSLEVSFQILLKILESLNIIPRLFVILSFTEAISMPEVVNYLMTFFPKEIIMADNLKVIILILESLSLLAYLISVTFLKETIGISDVEEISIFFTKTIDIAVELIWAGIYILYDSLSVAPSLIVKPELSETVQITKTVISLQSWLSRNIAISVDMWLRVLTLLQESLTVSKYLIASVFLTETVSIQSLVVDLFVGLNGQVTSDATLYTFVFTLLTDSLYTSKYLTTGIFELTDSLSIQDTIEDVMTLLGQTIGIDVILEVVSKTLKLLQDSLGITPYFSPAVGLWNLNPVGINDGIEESTTYFVKTGTESEILDGTWYADHSNNTPHQDWTDYQDTHTDAHSDWSNGHNDWTDHYNDHQDDIHNDWTDYLDHINHDDAIWSNNHLNWTNYSDHGDVTHGDWSDYTDHADWGDAHLNWTDNYNDTHDDDYVDWDDYEHNNWDNGHNNHEDHDDTYSDWDDIGFPEAHLNWGDYHSDHGNWTDHNDHQDDTHSNTGYSDHTNHDDSLWTDSPHQNWTNYNDHQDDIHTDSWGNEHDDWANGHNNWTDHYEDHQDDIHSDWTDYIDHLNHDDVIWTDDPHQNWTNHTDWTDSVHTDWTNNPHQDIEAHTDTWNWTDHLDDISPTGGVAHWGRNQINATNTTVNHCRAMGGQSPSRSGMKLKAIAIYVNNAPGNLRLAVYQGGSLTTGPVGSTLKWDAGTIGVGQTGTWVVKYCTSDVTLAANTPTWVVWKGHDGTREVRYDTTSAGAGDFQTARGRWESFSISSDYSIAYPSTWPSDPSGGFADYWYSTCIIYRW